MDNWAKEELGGADLGDERLNNRLINGYFCPKPRKANPSSPLSKKRLYKSID
jgi:hypothetical protein